MAGTAATGVLAEARRRRARRRKQDAGFKIQDASCRMGASASCILDLVSLLSPRFSALKKITRLQTAPQSVASSLRYAIRQQQQIANPSGGYLSAMTAAAPKRVSVMTHRTRMLLRISIYYS